MSYTSKYKSPKVKLSFDVEKNSKGVVLNPDVLSKTVQSQKDQVDINRIMKNHNENGGLIGNPMAKPLTGDFTEYGDYREIRTRAVQAEQIFELQPLDIRKMFHYKPEEFFDFLLDETNNKEAVELGLKDKRVLKTVLADDGVRRLTPHEKAIEDAEKAKKKPDDPAPGQQDPNVLRSRNAEGRFN